MDIVDLRAETNAISLARDQSSAFRKSSESQTDAAEVIRDSLALLSAPYSKGVDFDWDLSDKTDTETQTRRGTNDPHAGPADAIVQVFLQIKTKHCLHKISYFSSQTLE